MYLLAAHLMKNAVVIDVRRVAHGEDGRLGKALSGVGGGGAVAVGGMDGGTYPALAGFACAFVVTFFAAQCEG